eukprot:gnl/MRDRNA2_/MRDRNA2_112512_c0_seq1.p1 gnl/MRDRNA2_/MRDRNA2_112512_c0~~gnl/MRDRNA2_/MRDRNA2_112512_c0_seq1.p1  ORF type:complete len:949 (-),score=300.13 gnl/MRDRNA2_/MRDRNA2_112512_c0_seq1:32-2878(-)
MEVQVIQAENVPEGSLLSIRAGTTRRQAHADAKQRFRFPKGQEHVSDPLKIDILSPLGGSRLTLKGEQERYTVPIKSADGSRTMNITLEVKGAVVDGMKLTSPLTSPPAKDSPDCKGGASRRHLAALQAREYLDEHSVLQVVQSLLQNIVKERPQDPWAYMQQNLPDGIKKAAFAPEETKAPPKLLPSPEVQVAAKAPEAEAAPAKPAPGPYDEVAEVAPEPSKAPEAVAPVEGPVAQASVSFTIKNVGFALLDDEAKEQLKSGVRKSLAESAGVAESLVTVNLSAGSVRVEALINVPVERPMGALKETLMQANLNRKVLQIATSINGVSKAAYGDIDVMAPEITIVKTPEPSADVDIDAVRERMKDSFEQGITDGTLQSLLAGSELGTAQESKDPNTVNLEAVRAKARQNLEEGIINGKLEKMVTDSTTCEPDIDQIRLKAKKTLEKGCDDNLLSQCLGKNAASEPSTSLQADIDNLRMKACASLEKSALNGQLIKCLAEQDDIVDAKVADPVPDQKAPAPAPKQSAPAAKKKSGVTKKGSAMLLAGLKDGSLEKIVDDMEAKFEAEAQTTSKTEPWNQQPSVGSWLGDLRPGTAGTSAPGWLQKPSVGTWLCPLPLKEVDPQVAAADAIDLDDLRSKVRTTFETGLETGSLCDALKEGGVMGAVENDVDIDVLRQRTSQKLSEGLESGKLEMLLGEPAPEPASQGDSKPDLDTLRLKAQGALDHAVCSGDLIMYLQEEFSHDSTASSTTTKKDGIVASESELAPAPAPAPPVLDMQALRLKAQKSLERGAESGVLQQTLANEQAVATPAPAADAQPVKAGIDIAQARLKAQQSLDRGVQDGTLEKIMLAENAKETPPKAVATENAEDMLKKAQEDLAIAMSTGETKEDNEWVAEQEEVKVLWQEVDSIKDLNEKAKCENNTLRQENEALQAQLAQLLELEELDAQS